MKLGYLYIESDKVIWNPKKIPNINRYTSSLNYIMNKTEWQENNIVVENSWIGFKLRYYSPAILC